MHRLDTNHTRWPNGSETWIGENWLIHWGGPYSQSFSWSAWRTEDEMLADSTPAGEGFIDLVNLSEGLATARAAIYAALVG